MPQDELMNISIAILVFALVLGFKHIFPFDALLLGKAIFFAFLIITISVLAKKGMAYNLDSSVQHEIWRWSQYGYPTSWKLKREIPAGVIVPLFFTAFSLGLLKVPTLLTYETSALKRRAARRFGHYSFTEMTDWHIALIGGAGISAVLVLSAVSYFIPGLEGLPSAAAFYAFFNLIPFSKLDGSQIFFGSRVVWTILALISSILVLLTFTIV